MSRETFAERIWWETDVPVFFEKFILPLLATSIVVLIWTNPMKFDWPSRIGLCIGLFALAYVAAHQTHLRNEALRIGTPPATQLSGGVSTPLQTVPPTVNTTTGTGSPILPNNNGDVTINNDTPKSKDSAPKDKPK